jgi:hypothetical protein
LAPNTEHMMHRIVIQKEVAEQIRQSEGQVELVDDQGQQVAIARRPPTQEEIEFAKSRMGSKGPKFTAEK